MGKDKEAVKYLRAILETMDPEYASKFASVIDRARQAGLTDSRELRRMLEETQPEAVEVWEDHLYSNRDPECENMSFEEFQAGLRGRPNEVNEESEKIIEETVGKTIEKPDTSDEVVEDHGIPIDGSGGLERYEDLTDGFNESNTDEADDFSGNFSDDMDSDFSEDFSI